MSLDYDPVLIVVKLSCVFGCHNAMCPDGLKTVDVFPVGIVGFVFICLDVGNNCFVHKTNTHGRLPYIIAVGCSFSTDGNSLLDLILFICRKTSEMSIANSTRACVYCWLIVAYTAGGKALALFLVVSFWIIFCLTGPIYLHCFMADSISFGIETLGKGVMKETAERGLLFCGTR